MKKVLHCDVQGGDYRSGAAVVWCFDARFSIPYPKLMKRLGIENPDLIRIAGGAKSLATPERESDPAFVLDQIRKSIRLHQTPRVILMVHSDCGTYGGLKAFQGDVKMEAEHHQQELRRAAHIVRQEIPGIEVQAYFVDFEGIWEVETPSLAVSTANT